MKIIDSSTLPLNLNNHSWAEFRKTKSGIKLHLRFVFMENGCSYPDHAVLTNAKEHDRGQLEVLVDDKECLYVFDRGYLDYERFDLMTDEGYFFVSRLRKNAVVRMLEHFDLPEDTVVLSDEIAELYKSRWAIELFFKWMKQHLNIKKFYTQSEQGVHNQVYLAMIVYCLNVLAQLRTKSKANLLTDQPLCKGVFMEVRAYLASENRRQKRAVTQVISFCHSSKRYSEKNGC